MNIFSNFQQNNVISFKQSGLKKIYNKHCWSILSFKCTGNLHVGKSSQQPCEGGSKHKHWFIITALFSKPCQPSVTIPWGHTNYDHTFLHFRVAWQVSHKCPSSVSDWSTADLLRGSRTFHCGHLLVKLHNWQGKDYPTTSYAIQQDQIGSTHWIKINVKTTHPWQLLHTVDKRRGKNDNIYCYFVTLRYNTSPVVKYNLPAGCVITIRAL